MSDTEQLIERLRSGDDEALGPLMHAFGQRLRRVIRFRLDPRLQGRVDEEDVLQESYLSAAQRLGHWRQREQDIDLFIWLRLIVQQTLIDVHRRHLGVQARDAGREVSMQMRMAGPMATSASMAIGLAGSLTSPSRVVAREELVDQLSGVIESMAPIDREVLALRHFEELSNREVAAVLEIQEKAASIRYIRALKRLKQRVKMLSGFQDGDPWQ